MNNERIAIELNALSAYLHHDWVSFYETEEKAVEKFFSDSSNAEIMSFREAVIQLLDLSDPEIDKLSIETGVLDYNPDREYSSHRDWYRSLRDRASQALSRRGSGA